MPLITHFHQHRTDGKVVDEAMTLEEILRRGWSPDAIIGIEWEFRGQHIGLKFPKGVLPKVLPMRDGIALICQGGLSVINGDGTERFRIPNEQNIKGKVVSGEFRWFEPARNGSPDRLGAVFQTKSADSFGYDLCLEFDVATGVILETFLTR